MTIVPAAPKIVSSLKIESCKEEMVEWLYLLLPTEDFLSLKDRIERESFSRWYVAISANYRQGAKLVEDELGSDEGYCARIKILFDHSGYEWAHSDDPLKQWVDKVKITYE